MDYKFGQDFGWAVVTAIIVVVALVSIYVWNS